MNVGSGLLEAGGCCWARGAVPNSPPDNFCVWGVADVDDEKLNEGVTDEAAVVVVVWAPNIPGPPRGLFCNPPRIIPPELLLCGC